MSSGMAENPSRGAGSRHVREQTPLNPVHAVDWQSVSGYGPMTSTNRHVRAHRKCPWGSPACVVVWGGTVKGGPYPIRPVSIECLVVS
jgi:hypothetical protein